MADVFISYSKPDRSQVQSLADDLVRRGFSVWWDTGLLAGNTFRQEIDRELRAASCVVVVWSRHSMASDWVISEAESARQAGKLVPVRTETLAPHLIPRPFTEFHTELLTAKDRIAAAIVRIQTVTPESGAASGLWDDGTQSADVIGEAPVFGTEFRDLPYAPLLTVVPSGGFRMGSPPREPARLANEGPQHFVRLPSPLAVGKYPVTFAEWDQYCDLTASPYRPPDAGFGRADRPVINVSWDDALGYCDWLSATSGQRYRLLTEAEWEFCCRAGTTTRFAFGNQLSTEEANFNGSAHPVPGSANTFRARTTPVGLFQPNGFGLFDMHGNVCEWVRDPWHDDYQGAPEDGRAWLGPGARRVLRGGSWYDYPQHVRSARRAWATQSERAPNIGLRVCRELDPPSG